jgi:hypothetical protein
MKKSVVTRMSLLSDKDVGTYLLKSRLDVKLGSLQVLPWNLLQLISYFFAFIIYSINLLKTARKTFATGNAIYPLSRTIIQITNDNSIFRKEGFAITRVIVLASSYLFLTGYVHFRLHNCKRHKTFKKLKKLADFRENATSLNKKH